MSIAEPLTQEGPENRLGAMFVCAAISAMSSFVRFTARAPMIRFVGSDTIVVIAYGHEAPEGNVCT